MVKLGNSFGMVVGCIPFFDVDGRGLVSSCHARKRLISSLLQERGELRMLCAPRGFGKTTLAREYAATVFADTNVFWADCANPAFLCLIDDGYFSSAAALYDHLDGLSELACQSRHLFVFDDLCYLDGMRSEAFSEGIDALIDEGHEVIVISTPSCDNLHSLQSGRVLLGASNLALADDEIRETMHSESTASGFGSVRSYGIPSLIWGNSEKAVIALARGFYDEGIPSDMALPATVMLLLCDGKLSDIEGLGIKVPLDTLPFLSANYPFFGVDPIACSFDTVPLPVCEVVCMAQSELVDWVAHGLLMDKLVDSLISAGKSERAAQLIACFCPEPRRGGLAKRVAWRLLDMEQYEALSFLLEHVGRAALIGSLELQADKAWCAFLSGNMKGAFGLIANARFGVSCSLGSLELAALAIVLAHDDSLPGTPSDKVSFLHLNEAAWLDGPVCRLSKGGVEGAAVGGTSECACSLGGSSLCRAWSCLVHMLWVLAPRESPGEPGGDLVLHTLSYDGLKSLFEIVGSLEGPMDNIPTRFSLHLVLSYLSHVPRSGELDGETVEAAKRVVSLAEAAVAHCASRGASGYSEALLLADLANHGYWEGWHIPVGKARNLDGRSLALVHGNEHVCLYLQTHVRPLSFCSPVLNGNPSLENGQHPKPKVGTREETTAIQMGPRQAADVMTFPKMRVHLFGGFEVGFDGMEYPDEGWRQRNVRCLLSLLVLAKGNEVSRDAVLEFLWPGLRYEKARDNLYSVWKNLRRLCGVTTANVPYIHRTTTYCRLDPRLVTSDVGEFEQLERRSIALSTDDHEALKVYLRMEALYTGDILGGDFVASGLELDRSHYRRMFTDAMLRASRCANTCGDLDAQLWLARRAHDAGNTSEETYLGIMRACCDMGRIKDALAIYEDCRLFLRDIIGAKPSKEMMALHDELVMRQCRGVGSKGSRFSS